MKVAIKRLKAMSKHDGYGEWLSDWFSNKRVELSDELDFLASDIPEVSQEEWRFTSKNKKRN